MNIIHKSDCDGCYVYMRYLSLFLLVVSSFALSGDGADSEIRYELDLSINYSKYVMSPKDIEWSNKLVNRLGYEGDVLHFVLTDIVLVEANKKLSGKIYQSVENPGRYYVLTGDIGIDTKLGIIGNAGAGGILCILQNRRSSSCALIAGMESQWLGTQQFIKARYIGTGRTI